MARPYCTATQIRNELNNLPADGSGAANYSNDRIEERINRADSLIDSYCASVYSIPFGTVTKIVELMSIEVTCYFIMRSLYSSDSHNVMEWTEKYKEVIKRLEEIRDGKLQIVDSTGSELTKVGSRIRSNTKDYIPEGDIDLIEYWEKSGTKLDNIADDREADD